MKQLLSFSFALLFSPILFSQQSGFLNNLNNYIENLAVFESGQEAPRAYHIPEQHLSLNGQWRFFYSETPEGIPSDFYERNYDDSQWSSIKVPSNWEMEGYGDPLFRNISTTFDLGRPANAPEDPYRAFSPEKPKNAFTVIPPEVPDEYNPTGAYRTSFVLPKGWKKQQVFLRFEKVASASFVWVNGQEVGYNEGAQEPSEYNITPYLRSGKNTIAVLVFKFSDGYYLEGQDYWRLAGIFDDVNVFSTPPTRIFDWQVITDFDEDYVNADLNAHIQIKNHGGLEGNYHVRGSLAKDGVVISNIKSSPVEIKGNSSETVSTSNQVQNPEKWTSETPHLYELRLELLNSENKVIDKIDTRMGFQETAIIGNTFYLNGVPVKINAINSHMQHPELGHVMDEATIRKDFEILKQFNFNAVRTSHYPPVNKYLELANEYGLFVIDEAGTEAHATEYVSQMPEYIPMYRDRVRKMVLRDRNYPCILFWSAGNESGEGNNIREVIEEGKKWDPTRYWMYGGNADRHPAEEIIGPRYPSQIELDINFGMDPNSRRPSFLDEYLSIAGNGGGGMDEYWQVLYKHPRLMGGAIWDFVSPGLTEPVRALKDQSPYSTPVHIMGDAQLVKSQNGKAIDLNGHDQWVEVYRAEQVEITGEQLSLVLDIFPRKLMKSSGPIISKGNNQFGLQQNESDELEFYIYTDKKVSLKATLPENWENEWHHLMATYDGKEMMIQVDGITVAQKEAKGSIQNFPYPINIGKNVETHEQNLAVYLCDALLDNVGIFTQALDDEELKAENAVLWLDFEEEKSEGTFFSYGIGARTYGAIWPDRSVQPEMWQMKKSVQPLSFKLLDVQQGLIEVWNRSNFTNASFWETTWTLTEDEKVLQSGTLDLNTAVQNKDFIKIPYQKPEIIAGKEYRLNISSRLRKEEIWAAKGFEISWEQIELKEWYLPTYPTDSKTSPAQLKQTKNEYIINGNGFSYTFDAQSGMLQSMKSDGEELLKSPLKLNAWRAPIANELDHWNGMTFKTNRWKEGYGPTLATDYYSNGIHELKYVPVDVNAFEQEGKVYVNVREYALTHNGKKNYTMLDRYISGLTMSGFESIYQYVIAGDGSITISHEIQARGNMPQMLPRIGLSLMLSPQLDQVEWYGRGPQENYPDRKSGYRVGIYNTTVEDMYEPYLIPQDYGLRTDNRWIKMTNKDGKGIAFSMDTYFNFNAYPYTTENLTKALYHYQLHKAEGITLNLDYNTTGVGGTARLVLPSYRAYPQLYSRTITIMPVK